MRILLLVVAVLAAAFVVPSPSAQDLPPDSFATVVAVLEADGRFGTLLDALDAANLTETLSEPGPFTLFAPTDSAFAALPEGTLDTLTAEQLQDVLLHHVVSGVVASEAAAAAGEAPTAWSDSVLTFAPTASGGLTVDGATVTDADVAASNGVVHVIDAVLLPPAEEPDGT